MNKKLLLHIILCALLFVSITVPYAILTSGEDIPSQSAGLSQETDAEIVQDGDIIMIGDKTELSYLPNSVHPGDNTRIEIIGAPNTLYNINVYYPSGLSAAKAFADKYSTEDGRVSWEFKVSAKTTAEKLRVVIRSENSYLSFYIPITKL